jgi:hypothetical protein
VQENDGGTAGPDLVRDHQLGDRRRLGPAYSTITALGGTTTGFSHTPSTVTTPAGGPYVSGAFSWTAGATSSPTETVLGADVAGNTAGTALTFTNDSTPPAGGSADATGLTGTGSRYSTSTALSVAFGKGADTGVGLAISGATLWRATGTLSAGSCTGFAPYMLVSTDPTTPYAETVADRDCYRYQYVVADVHRPRGDDHVGHSGGAVVAAVPRVGRLALARSGESARTIQLAGYAVADPAVPTRGRGRAVRPVRASTRCALAVAMTARTGSSRAPPSQHGVDRAAAPASCPRLDL